MRKGEQMAPLDEIGQQRQRISERLAQLDAERTKLSDQLNDLETCRTRTEAIRWKSGHDQGPEERTPGRDYAGNPW